MNLWAYRKKHLLLIFIEEKEAWDPREDWMGWSQDRRIEDGQAGCQASLGYASA
jgi:hypothetical protein